MPFLREVNKNQNSTSGVCIYKCLMCLKIKRFISCFILILLPHHIGVKYSLIVLWIKVFAINIRLIKAVFLWWEHRQFILIFASHGSISPAPAPCHHPNMIREIDLNFYRKCFVWELEVYYYSVLERWQVLLVQVKKVLRTFCHLWLITVVTIKVVW